MSASARTPSARPWAGRRMHFVGVGGAGLSAYARAAHALGASVSGSDSAEGPYLQRLAADGVLQAQIGHVADNVPDGEDVELVYSSAVSDDNAERRVARERGLRERPRADLLARADRAAAHDRRGGHARQDDDRGDGRARAARRRTGPGLAGRRHDRRRAGELALERRRLAGGGGRRVGPLDAQYRRRDRGDHERRARPSRDVRLAARAARGVRAVRRPRAACAGRVGPARAAGAGAQRRGRRRGRPLRRRRADARAGRLAL